MDLIKTMTDILQILVTLVIYAIICYETFYWGNKLLIKVTGINYLEEVAKMICKLTGKQ